MEHKIILFQITLETKEQKEQIFKLQLFWFTYLK